MLNRITTWMLAGELVLFLLWFLHRPRRPVETVGGLVVAGSVGLLVVARRQLGQSFSVRAKATRLVTTGVYARVRNPIYVAGCLVVVGVALLVESWWPLLVLLVLIPMQVLRARREAAVLRAQFGEEYERYRRRTWF